MSSDTPRSIDRTPRQVAGPGVDDRPGTTPRDPHPLADPDDAGDLRAGDEVDLRDPDVAPVEDEPDVVSRDDEDEPDVVSRDDVVPAEPAEDDPEPVSRGDVVPAEDDPHAVRRRDVVPVEDEAAWRGDAPPVEAGIAADMAASDPDAGAHADWVSESDPEPDVRGDWVSEAGTEIEPDPEAGGEGDRVSEPDPEPGADGDGQSEAGTGPSRFMVDAASLRERWERVQVGFVDDPRRAVEEAHAMVSSAVVELQAEIDRQRAELGDPWRDDTTSTDALRSAFRGYRDLFDRVLSV